MDSIHDHLVACKIPPPEVRAKQVLEIYGDGPQHFGRLEDRVQRVVSQWTRLCLGGNGKVARSTNESVLLLMETFPVASDRICAMQLCRLVSLQRLRDTLGYVDLKLGFPLTDSNGCISVDKSQRKMLRGGRGNLMIVALDEEANWWPCACSQPGGHRNYGRQPSIEKLSAGKNFLARVKPCIGIWAGKKNADPNAESPRTLTEST
ncbi:hypothetical protein BDW59DRAFT_166328 [Aspergillus cavernicola]|uniref:Uncharacterized protein n=1 Tax=Aspergillus cavernicola TaxID=176166 RepID=A0ABR4HMA3_9EURO